MPITSSAKKALRVSKRKAVFNARRKNKMNDAVKAVKKLVAGKKIDEAKKALVSAYSALDKAAKEHTILKNNASRMKSRLSALVKKSDSK